MPLRKRHFGLMAFLLILPAGFVRAEEEEILVEEETLEVTEEAPAEAAAEPAAEGVDLAAEVEPAAPAAPAKKAEAAAKAPESAAPAEEAAAETAAEEAPAEEAAATEEPAVAEEASAEEAAAETEAAPAEAAASEPEPVPEAKAEGPVAEEPVTEAPGAEEPVVEEAVVEAPAAPAPAPDLAMPEVALPAAEPALAPSLPAWSTQAQAWAFDDFVRCGFSIRDARSATATVMRPADDGRDSALPGDDVLISGTHPRGQMFAAYRPAGAGCGYRYLGLVMVRAPAERGVCRALVKRAADVLLSGDLLYPYDALREAFLAQRERAARGGGAKRLAATVRCLPDGREVIASADDMLLVDRGSSHGVVWGDLFVMDLPGGEGGRTVGRVIRVERDQSYLKLARVVQPVRIGDRLTAVEPAPPPKSASRAPAAGARRSRPRR